MYALLAALVVLHASPAHADCKADVTTLKAAIKEPNPQQTAADYPKVAACDAKAGKDLAPSAFAIIIPGEAGVTAAVAALQAGAADTVRTWIANQQSDERAGTLAGLGRACNGNAVVVNFFVESQKALGTRFWSERWQRGLADCREPAIQTFLSDALKTEENQRDPSRFGAILEVYCRNVGARAIPTLKDLAGSTNEELQIPVMGAFADAAGVGSSEGMDAAAAREAVSAIVEVAPKVAPKAVDQARTTVQSLGDMDTANKLAGIRFANVKQPDGTWIWAAVAVEKATCKNKKSQTSIHSGLVKERGTHWPDQMVDAADPVLREAWELDLAQKCKGEGTVQFILSPEPMANVENAAAWSEGVIREIKKQTTDKISESSEDPVELP